MDVDPNHFAVDSGEVLYPQPWMQLRHVAGDTVAAKSGNYGSSGGSNKDDLIQTLQVAWKNDSPIGALVYAEVTRGGTKVTLQATSNGGLLYRHGRSVVPGPITLVDASRIAVGLDVGRGGTLMTNQAFGISEVRQHATTMPLCPEQTGLVRLAPAATFTARVDVRFVTTSWNGTDPDGGAAGAESTYSAGALTIDIFALPDFDWVPPPTG